jgi:hypothetical protein
MKMKNLRRKPRLIQAFHFSYKEIRAPEELIHLQKIPE